MANLVQLRSLEELNAVLLVDKPAGLAFSTVVKTVKRKFNLVKVGHGGALDAMASGLLVLLINDANKFVGDVMGADRAYTGTMRLGLATDTHDVHGRVLGESPSGYAPERLAAALKEFKGDVFQTEPRFASVRREGSAAYEVADTGDHTPFLTHVYRFEVAPSVRPDRLDFTLSGSKSVLVRTLVNDFGAQLGCGAALEALRRTRVGQLAVEAAVPLERLLECPLADFAALTLPLKDYLARR